MKCFEEESNGIVLGDWTCELEKILDEKRKQEKIRAHINIKTRQKFQLKKITRI